MPRKKSDQLGNADVPVQEEHPQPNQTPEEVSEAQAESAAQDERSEMFQDVREEAQVNSQNDQTLSEDSDDSDTDS